MRRVKNQKIVRKIADRTRKAGKNRNVISVLAIALTTVLFTSVFTIGGSLMKKQQEETMRQVGGSSHAGYKYLTQAEYDIVKKDKKLKEVSYRIVVGEVVNEELKKLRTEANYYEDLDAKFSFCYPEAGHMPEKEDEIVTSDLVLNKLGIPCKVGQKVPLVLKVGDQTIEKTFILSGYFKGDPISKAQVAAVSKEYANKVAPTPASSAMETQVDASGYVGRIMADFNFATSIDLEKQAAELSKRCGFPEDVDTGINWAYLGGQMDMETVLLIVSLLPKIMGTLVFSGTVDTKVVLNPWIFIGAAAFSLITVYISCIKPCRIASKVSPVEAVRYTEGQDAVYKKKIVIVVASLTLA